MSAYIGEAYGEWSLWFNLSNDAESMIVTCGFKDVDPTDPLSNLVTRLRNTVLGTGKLIDVGTMYSNYQLTRVRVVARRSGDLVLAEDNTPAVGTVPVTTTVQPPANNSAILVQKRSNTLGRRNRGRMFLPPYDLLNTSVNSLGNINAAYVTAKQTVFNTLMTSLLGATNMPPYILHSTSEILPRPFGTFAVQSKVATQRRRMRK